MVWVFLVEMMNGCSVNFLYMLSYNFVLYLVLSLLAKSSNLKTWNLSVAKAWSKSKFLWAMIWSKQSCYDLFLCDAWYPEYFILKTQKYIKKFLDDLKFLSKAICWSHCKTFHICNLLSHRALSNCCEP